jgi:hypothetical protein
MCVNVGHGIVPGVLPLSTIDRRATRAKLAAQYVPPCGYRTGAAAVKFAKQFGVQMVIVSIVGVAAVAFAAKKEAPTEWDGLQKKEVKGIDLAYVRPGADISAYKKIILDPVVVSFSKDWNPQKTGSRISISQADRDKIKEKLGNLVMQVFTDVLSENNGYPIVKEAAPDVMRLSTGLADVYINAPDIPSAGRSKTYVTNAGRMTLVAELRDAETGALFARIIDAREARDTLGLTWSNSVENSSEAYQIAKQWATIVRKRLDAVRSAPVTPAQ